LKDAKNNTPMKNTFQFLSSYQLGLVAWIVFALVALPTSPFSLHWVYVLLLAAPLWLIPLHLKTIKVQRIFQLWAVPVALPLVGAYLMDASWIAGCLAFPWLLFSIILCFNSFSKAPNYCAKAAFLYLPIGAAWLFADRMAWQPLGFSSTIVLLTAAHFHYAGFILPMLTAEVLVFYKNKIKKLVRWSVILGIPLVAIGITTSQLDWPAPIEVAAVTIMAVAGWCFGLMHLSLGWRKRKELFGWLWMFCGLALMTGMTLAFLYGWRYYWPISFLSIPWMYAVHGTLNAIGFAIPGVLHRSSSGCKITMWVIDYVSMVTPWVYSDQ
jgi:hypothetical protein